MGILNIFQSKKSLESKIKILEKEIKHCVSRVCSENFSVLRYGEYRIDPKNLVFWICVDTDKMKLKLENNVELNNELRELLVINKYPEEAIKNVHIGFEAKETVDRVSEGNWYFHFK